MNVWDELKKLKRMHEAEVAELVAKVRELHDAQAFLSISDYGVWRLTWRKALVAHELTGRSAAQLLEQARATAPKKPLELQGGGSPAMSTDSRRAA